MDVVEAVVAVVEAVAGAEVEAEVVYEEVVAEGDEDTPQLTFPACHVNSIFKTLTHSPTNNGTDSVKSRGRQFGHSVIYIAEITMMMLVRLAKNPSQGDQIQDKSISLYRCHLCHRHPTITRHHSRQIYHKMRYPRDQQMMGVHSVAD